MKILLIRPKPDKETIGLQHVMICEPLELEYIAGNIDKENIDVEIIDMIIENKPLDYFINKHQPDIVAMGGYITHVNIIKRYAKRIKDLMPSCKVIVGGVHGEVVPQDFVDESIDFIIEANGIKTFNRILDIPHSKDIEGTYRLGKKCKKETSFLYNPPNREKVKKYRSKYYYMFHNPCALIKTSFGCPYNCSFCFCKEITNGAYYTRPIDSVIEELKEIPEKEIYIVDDDFLFSKERILEFCKGLQEKNIDKRFLVYGRADFISKNEDIIKTFKKHGLSAVIVGLESIKNEDLSKYNKRTSLWENEEAIRVLKKYGIEVYGTIILDMEFTLNDFKNLYLWIKRHGLIFVNLQPLTPLPGTEIYKKLKDQLIVPRDSFEKWDLAHLVLKPNRMSPRRYYFEILKLYSLITLNPINIAKLIRKYGIWDVLKLSKGSGIITGQYVKKIIRGH